MVATMSVQGTETTVRRLDKLQTDLIRKGLLKATRASGRVYVRRAKRDAPRDKGDFRDTFGQSAKVNKQAGKVDGQIGQSTRLRKKRRAVHLHLVENPTKAHPITRRIGTRTQTVQHPGTRGSDFFKRVARKEANKAEQKFGDTLERFVASINFGAIR